jgi:hypothetical protein
MLFICAIYIFFYKNIFISKALCAFKIVCTVFKFEWHCYSFVFICSQNVEKSPEKDQGGYKLTPRNTVATYTAAERKFKKTPRIEVSYSMIQFVL